MRWDKNEGDLGVEDKALFEGVGRLWRYLFGLYSVCGAERMGFEPQFLLVTLY